MVRNSVAYKLNLMITLSRNNLLRNRRYTKNVSIRTKQAWRSINAIQTKKSKNIIKKKKAKVINRTPFTIQLLYGSSGYNQPINPGVDAEVNILVYLQLKKNRNFSMLLLN